MSQNRSRTFVYLNFVPFDAILDVGSIICMIDVKVCKTLGLPVNPFNCDISPCVGMEGASVVKSLISVLGWIEVELGILGLGCILARFWVTDCSYDNGVPVILGSHQTKKVYGQVRIENINYLPAPWKDLYTWSVVNKWYGDRCSEDLDDLYIQIQITMTLTILAVATPW